MALLKNVTLCCSISYSEFLLFKFKRGSLAPPPSSYQRRKIKERPPCLVSAKPVACGSTTCSSASSTCVAAITKTNNPSFLSVVGAKVAFVLNGGFLTWISGGLSTTLSKVYRFYTTKSVHQLWVKKQEISQAWLGVGSVVSLVGGGLTNVGGVIGTTAHYLIGAVGGGLHSIGGAVISGINAIVQTKAPLVGLKDYKVKTIVARQMKTINSTDWPDLPFLDALLGFSLVLAGLFTLKYLYHITKPIVPTIDTPIVPTIDTPIVSTIDTPIVPTIDTPIVPTIDTPIVAAIDNVLMPKGLVLPGLPIIPDVSSLTGLPTIPGVSPLTGVPIVPDVSPLTGVPIVPDVSPITGVLIIPDVPFTTVITDSSAVTSIFTKGVNMLLSDVVWFMMLVVSLLAALAHINRAALYTIIDRLLTGFGFTNSSPTGGGSLPPNDPTNDPPSDPPNDPPTPEEGESSEPAPTPPIVRPIWMLWNFNLHWVQMFCDDLFKFLYEVKLFVKSMRDSWNRFLSMLKAALKTRRSFSSLTSTPVTTPVATPVATPVSTPVTTPVATPVATPVSTPVATPVSTPVATNPVA